jgi:hypothetical protein
MAVPNSRLWSGWRYAPSHGARACPFRPGCPGGTAARPMIMEIPQLICCFISMKTEIPVDQAAPGARAPHAGPRTALMVTTHHLVNGDEAVRR